MGGFPSRAPVTAARDGVAPSSAGASVVSVDTQELPRPPRFSNGGSRANGNGRAGRRRSRHSDSRAQDGHADRDDEWLATAISGGTPVAAVKPAAAPAQYAGSRTDHSPAYATTPGAAQQHKHGSDRSASTTAAGSGRSDASVRGVALREHSPDTANIVTLSRTQLPVPTVNSNASVQALAGPADSEPDTPPRPLRQSPLVPRGRIPALQPSLVATLVTPRSSPLPSPCQQSLTPRTGAARPSPDFRVASQDSVTR